MFSVSCPSRHWSWTYPPPSKLSSMRFIGRSVGDKDVQGHAVDGAAAEDVGVERVRLKGGGPAVFESGLDGVRAGDIRERYPGALLLLGVAVLRVWFSSRSRARCPASRYRSARSRAGTGHGSRRARRKSALEQQAVRQRRGVLGLCEPGRIQRQPPRGLGRGDDAAGAVVAPDAQEPRVVEAVAQLVAGGLVRNANGCDQFNTAPVSAGHKSLAGRLRHGSGVPGWLGLK